MTLSFLKKINIATLALSTIALALFPFVKNIASSADQTANLIIGPGSITITAPADFSFDPIFLTPGQTEPFYFYQALDPESASTVLKIFDSDNINNFKVTMDISNFRAPGKTIPYSNFSFVTLAEDTSSGIDVLSGNDANNFTIPEKCNWNLDEASLKDYCQSSFEPLSGNGVVSDPVDVITSTEPLNARSGVYSLGLGYKVLIDPTTMTPGEYDGTITFTLYQCADDSCL